jgi:hypothetical protein
MNNYVSNSPVTVENNRAIIYISGCFDNDKNASKLIMKRVSALNRFGSWTPERPVFLMGDFNVNGVYPSDHKPVLVEFELQDK